jgi:hypothetical protein
LNPPAALTPQFGVPPTEPNRIERDPVMVWVDGADCALLLPVDVEDGVVVLHEVTTTIDRQAAIPTITCTATHLAASRFKSVTSSTP